MGGVELNPSQSAAVERIADGPKVSRLVGYAGTGKTTVALRLPELLGWDASRTVFAAPTWRALSVLGGKASAAGVELPAVTTSCALTKKGADMMHCADCHKAGTASKELCHKRADPALICVCRELTFRGSTPREVADRYDTVIIDEASMLGIRDWADIERQVPSLQRVILVGDPGQLPPVHGWEDRRMFPHVTDDWSVLTLPGIAEAMLVGEERQIAGSPITALAHRVRDDAWPAHPIRPGLGQCTLTRSSAAAVAAHYDPTGQTITTDLPAGWGGGVTPDGLPILDGYAEVTFMHKVRVPRTAAIRESLWGKRPAPIEMGELVRTGKRDSTAGYVKHTRGTVTMVRQRTSSKTVCDVLLEDGVRLQGVPIDHQDLASPKADGDWSYGYVSTVHTAQGGEYREVTYLATGIDSTRLAYTAITRAARKLNIIGF